MKKQKNNIGGILILCFLLFSFVSLAQTFPGGVSGNLTLWVSGTDIDADGNAEGTSEEGLTTDWKMNGVWRDKSGENNHLSIYKGGDLSVLKAKFNYNAALKFSSHILRASSEGQITDNTAYTKFVVFSYDAVSANNLIGSSGNGPTLWGHSTESSVSLLNKWDIDISNSNFLTTDNSVALNQFYLAAARYGNGTQNNIININGEEKASNNEKRDFTAYKVQLGGFVNGNFLDGKIAEAIVYDRGLSDSEIDRVESYLALKYGLTLNHDYYASNGNLVWANQDVYNKHIVGIARDDNSNLLQKQSQSKDDICRIYLGTLSEDNSSNISSLSSDLQYLIMSDNAGLMNVTTASLQEKPTQIYSRIEREWQLTNTHFSEPFNLDFKLSDQANLSSIRQEDLRLLIDEDGDFTNASIYSTDNGIQFEVQSSGLISIKNISNTLLPENSIRYLTLASVNELTPLPIVLSRFELNLTSENKVRLEWQTLSEDNNDYFELQKSKDGLVWSSFNKINGAGISSTEIDYFAVDETPFLGTSYYRLKQVDFDESFTYSEVKSLNNKAFKTVRVYPNPCVDKLFIELDGANEMTVEITNVLVQDITFSVPFIFRNENQIQFDVSALESGVYFIKIGGHIYKILKQ